MKSCEQYQIHVLRSIVSGGLQWRRPFVDGVERHELAHKRSVGDLRRRRVDTALFEERVDLVGRQSVAERRENGAQLRQINVAGVGCVESFESGHHRSFLCSYILHTYTRACVESAFALDTTGGRETRLPANGISCA